MTLQRITRRQPLSPDEAAKYKAIRAQVAEELTELVARHVERLTILSDKEVPPPLRNADV